MLIKEFICFFCFEKFWMFGFQSIINFFFFENEKYYFYNFYLFEVIFVKKLNLEIFFLVVVWGLCCLKMIIIFNI